MMQNLPQDAINRRSLFMLFPVIALQGNGHHASIRIRSYLLFVNRIIFIEGQVHYNSLIIFGMHA